MGEWSFSTDGLVGSVEVRVENLTTGAEVPVTIDLKDPGYGQDTVGFTPSPPARVGNTYAVFVRAGGREWQYQTEVIACP